MIIESCIDEKVKSDSVFNQGAPREREGPRVLKTRFFDRTDLATNHHFFSKFFPYEGNLATFVENKGWAQLILCYSEIV